MKTLKDISKLKGVKVLIRADFNVPIEDGMVIDDYRIRVSLPTIEYLRKKGAKVILISHIEIADGLVKSGDDKNDVPKPTLMPVSSYLGSKGIPVTFVDSIASSYQVIEGMQNGDVVLIENLRENKGEKENDVVFAKELASLAEVYVNEAFPVSHREHASVCAITQFIPSYAGLQLEKEIENLSKAFDPAHPSVFILGGAKFETKLPLIQKLSDKYDTICIAGALANDVLKAKGYSVGASKVSDSITDISGVVNQPNMFVPVDVVVQDHIEKSAKKVAKEDMILDLGSKSLAEIKEKVDVANFILWNGPIGLCEKGFTKGTDEVAKMIASRTKSDLPTGQAGKKVVSIIGGGDTVAAIAKLGVEKDFTFVSTGGGAMLEFLEKGTLPGIEALNKSI